MNPPPATTAARIEDFLAHPRFAMASVSRNPKAFSHRLFGDLLARGYDVVPVNSHADKIADRACFPSVAAVTPPVEGALILTAPSRVNDVLADALDAGVARMWIHLSSGHDRISPELLRRVEENGASLIRGFCPYMFLSESGFIHRFHAWFAMRGRAYRA